MMELVEKLYKSADKTPIWGGDFCTSRIKIPHIHKEYPGHCICYIKWLLEIHYMQGEGY